MMDRKQVWKCMGWGAKAALLSSLLLTGGCSSWFEKDKPQPACPKVSILADANHLIRFRPGAGHDLTDVLVEAEFGHFDGSCQYDWKTMKMNVQLQVSLDARIGPAAGSERKAELAYFVAIPAYYPKPEAKIVASIPLTFPKNTDVVRYQDEQVELNLPIPEVKDMAKYEIFLGIQMTEDELDFARAHKQGN